MELSNDVQRLGLRIIESYERRTKIIMFLMKETVRLIADCSNEQGKMVRHIKNNITMVGCLRKKEFDDLMEGILNRIGKMNKVTKDVVEGCLTEDGKMVDKAADILSKALGGNGIGYTAAVNAEILPCHLEIERGLANVLMEFRKKQYAFTIALNGLMSKGDKVSIKDFKTMIYVMNIQYKKENNGIVMEKALEELVHNRQKLMLQWHEFFSAYEKSFAYKTDYQGSHHLSLEGAAVQSGF